MSNTAFFGLIDRDEAPAVIGLSVAFGIVFLVLYGGASVLSAYVPWRIRVDLPVDARIPFIPEAAAVYLSLILLLGMVPFVLRTLVQIWPLFCVLCFETLVGAVAFMLLPVEAAVSDESLRSTPNMLFSLADWLNLERNDLPSLHAAFTFTIAFALAGRTRLAGKCLLAAWAFAIVLSTLLTKQHQVADVLSGAALAWMSWRVVGRRSRRQ